MNASVSNFTIACPLLGCDKTSDKASGLTDTGLHAPHGAGDTSTHMHHRGQLHHVATGHRVNVIGTQAEHILVVGNRLFSNVYLIGRKNVTILMHLS